MRNAIACAVHSSALERFMTSCFDIMKEIGLFYMRKNLLLLYIRLHVGSGHKDLAAACHLHMALPRYLAQLAAHDGRLCPL